MSSFFSTVKQILSPTPSTPPTQTAQEFIQKTESGVPLNHADVKKLWNERLITLQPNNSLMELHFKSPIAARLTPGLLELMLKESPAEHLKQVTYVDLRKYELLVPPAPSLLGTYCPNLTKWDFRDEQLYDHAVIIGQTILKINSAIFSSHFQVPDDAFFPTIPCRSEAHFALYIRFLQHELSMQEFVKHLEQWNFPALADFLSDMDAKGLKVAREEVERVFEKKISPSRAFRSDITYQWYPYSAPHQLTFYKPLSRILTDAAFQRLLHPDYDDSIALLRVTDVIFPKDVKLKLGPQSLLFLLEKAPKLSKACIRGLLSRKEFCNKELPVKGETVCINTDALIRFDARAKKLWESIDFTDIEPQVIQDYISSIVGYEDKAMTLSRKTQLIAFMEKNQLNVKTKKPQETTLTEKMASLSLFEPTLKPKTAEQLLEKIKKNEPLGDQFICKLWDDRYIELRKSTVQSALRVELFFASPLDMHLSTDLLEQILKSLLPVVLEPVTYVNLKKCPSLALIAPFRPFGPSALTLLRTYCPNLKAWDMTDEQLSDHTVIVKDVPFRVHKELIAPHFPLHSSEAVSVVEVPYSAQAFKLYVQLLGRRLSLQEFGEALVDLEFPDLLKLLLDMKEKDKAFGRDEVQKAFETTIDFKPIHSNSDTYEVSESKITFHTPLCRVLTDRVLEKMFAGCTGKSTYTVTFPADVKLQLTPEALFFLATRLRLSRSCAWTLMSRPEFSDYQLQAQDGTVAINRKVLALCCQDSKTLWEAPCIDITTASKQLVHDYIVFIMRIFDDRMTPERLMRLLQFVRKQVLSLSQQYKKHAVEIANKVFESHAGHDEIQAETKRKLQALFLSLL